MKKNAAVYYSGRKAGILTKTDSGYEFAYLPEYVALPDAEPVSLSLPLAARKFQAEKLFPFFEGLLPEGWLLDITSTALKIDKNNEFELLLRVGRDVPGAVTIVPEDDNELPDMP